MKSYVIVASSVYHHLSKVYVRMRQYIFLSHKNNFIKQIIQSHMRRSFEKDEPQSISLKISC